MEVKIPCRGSLPDGKGENRILLSNNLGAGSCNVHPREMFHQAKILGRESSLPSRRYLEATEIRRRRPAVNCNSGWRLSA